MSSLKQYVIALDFGYPMNPQRRSTINDLAELIVRNYADEPETVVLAQEFIYDMLCRLGFPRERLLEVSTGQSGTDGTKSGGSYHMLRGASAILRQLRAVNWTSAIVSDEPPIRATVVAHALHVRRVMRQGRLFKLNLTPAEGLPTTLYRNAAQWWCRSRLAWYLREVIGFIPLWLAKQI